MSDEWFSMEKNRTHLKFLFSANAHPENEWMVDEKQESTFNSIFLSKNPKTISIRKRQTSFHFHYYYISIVSLSLFWSPYIHTVSSFVGLTFNICIVNVLWIRESNAKTTAFNFPAEKSQEFLAHCVILNVFYSWAQAFWVRSKRTNSQTKWIRTVKLRFAFIFGLYFFWYCICYRWKWRKKWKAKILTLFSTIGMYIYNSVCGQANKMRWTKNGQSFEKRKKCGHQILHSFCFCK